MGVENSNPDVEESTEPPLPSSIEGPAPPGVNQNPSRQEPALTALGFSEKTCDTTQSSPGPVYGDWTDQYQYAHAIQPEDVARSLDVDLQHGLSSTEAASRLKRDGPNKVKAAASVSLWKVLLRQVSNSLTFVLVLTMALSFGISDFIEGGVISAVILLNIVVGFVQDYRAEKQILSLQTLAVPFCKVLRDGRIDSIKAESLVVGDIVQVSTGDMIPADLRLFDGMNASTDEALLTGESLPVIKTPHITFTALELPIGDRTNMAYAATTVAQGRASGIVVCTAMKTEVGKIAELLREKKPYAEGAGPMSRAWLSFKDGMKNILGLIGTPLQVKLSKFALLLFALAITLAIIVFSANKWNVHGEVLIYGICVAVAVIPESLIAVLTITMAVGTKAMAKGNVIVRKLQALEAVGGVTNICSDKTGTLTQGKMIAKKAWIPMVGRLTVHDTTNPFDPTSGSVEAAWEIESDPLAPQSPMITFLNVIALCNMSTVYCGKADSIADGTSSIDPLDEWTAIGEPTEIALHVLAMRFNRGKPAILSSRQFELVTEFAFDSKIKRMTVIYKNYHTRQLEAFMKGAAEAVIPILAISDTRKEEILSTVEAMAGEGLRVLCIAHRTVDVGKKSQMLDREVAETDFQFFGLVGLYDPPRIETAGAVRKCQMAGITVHMLTGDHIRTATAIASEVGIIGPIETYGSKDGIGSSRVVMQAEVFDRMSDGEIDAFGALPLVLARCSPTTKVRMVEALHRRKAFCVMTGDGVNDSPALRRADVGIAMGLNGSDVAKEAADMVLTDDDFASIVKAVEEGRRLFDNIQKFLMHLLISNISQVILLLIALAFKDPDGNSIFPLSPLEILWVNLITSSFLALGLGLEEAQPDIMFRPPNDLRVGVFTKELITDKMIYGCFMGILCLVSFLSVAYGAGKADLGTNCNQDYNPTCDVVFRGRAATYATLTFLLLVTAWEVKHFSRSLFNFDPTRNTGPFSVFPTIWRNRFLFWSVVAGFTFTFPVIYTPVINRMVFKHEAITWEWGVVVGCLVTYTALVESWKAVKRSFKIGSGKHNILTMDDAERRAGLSPSNFQ